MRTFINDESGAVTVDWVVLTAGLVGLGLAVMGAVASGVEVASADIDETLSTQVISTSFSPDPGPVPFSPFNADDFNFAYDFYSDTFSDEESTNTAYQSDMTIAASYVQSGTKEEAQYAIDVMKGVEASAADSGYSLGPVDVDGEPYTADTLIEVYDTRFASS